MNRFLKALPVQTRALLLFAAAVLLPAAALAFIGMRTIAQERKSGEEQIRQQLGRTADKAARLLKEELGWWQKQMDEIQPDRFAPHLLPDRIRTAFAKPGCAVALIFHEDNVRAIPRGQLLFTVQYASTDDDTPGVIVEADVLAARAGESQKLDLYGRILAENPDPSLRLWILQRMAGIDAQTGRHREALRIYDELIRIPGAYLGKLPAELIGRFAICSLLKTHGSPAEAAAAAFELRRALVSGKWQLEKTRYLFYSTATSQWLDQIPEQNRQERRQLEQLEESKRILTEVAERVVQTWHATERKLPAIVSSRAGPAFAFQYSSSAQADASVLLLSPAFVMESLLPASLASAEADGASLALTSPDGRVVYGSRPAMWHANAMRITRDLRMLDESWSLDVWPPRPEALMSNLERRQWLYFGMLALILVSLVFGVATSAQTFRKQLEIARLKSEFASAVSHEFRSPLTGIRQLTEILSSNRMPDEQRKAEYYAMILEEVDRLSAMVENVLSFSRIREKRGPGGIEEVPMGAWLQETIDRFRNSPAAAGASIQVSISEDLPSLKLDKDAFARALGNLLDNAIKYSQQEKAVWVYAEQDRDQVRIRVRDQGIGIDDEDLKHIFDRFYRGCNEAVRQVGGTGLGLSLVKEVVQAHGGQINVESVPGVGTTFIITLSRIAAGNSHLL